MPPIPPTPPGGFSTVLNQQTPPSDSVVQLINVAGVIRAVMGDGTQISLGGGGVPTQIVNGPGDISISALGAVTGSVASLLITSGTNQIFMDGTGNVGLISSSGANLLVNGAGNSQLLGSPGNSIIALGNGSNTMTAVGVGQSSLIRFFPLGGQVLCDATGVTITCGVNTFRFTSSGEFIINGNAGAAGQRVTSGGVGAAITWAA